MVAPYGSFVWYELLTPDMSAATRFYESVIGWASRDAGMPRPYTLLETQGAGVGGIMALDEDLKARGVPPHWTGYILVEDIEKTVSAIKGAGGQCLWGPERIDPVGSLAAVADPQGATFSLLQPAPLDQPRPKIPPGTPGQTGWNELHAADGASAFAFYSTLFGWTKNQSVSMGEHGIYQTFDIGTDWTGGMMTKMAHTPHPHWLYYFTVDSAGAAAGRIKEAGGDVLFGPQSVPGGSIIVQARDPQGAHFAVISRAP